MMTKRETHCHPHRAEKIHLSTVKVGVSTKCWFSA